MRIKELSAEERPREKMLAKGADAMSNAELLAILLGSGTKKENVLEVANRLLSRAGGEVAAIAGMPQLEMLSVNGIGPNKQAVIAAAVELGKRCCLQAPGIEKTAVNEAVTVFKMMIPRLKGLTHEEFWVIFLNRANFIVHKEMMSLGGTNSTIVDAKLVVKKALDKNASGIILVHNHPSGSPRPGQDDISVTELLKKASDTFSISLIDHIIICDDCFFSFADDRVTSARIEDKTRGAM